MELKIDKIKRKFNEWTYNLWDKIGETNKWHVLRMSRIKRTIKIRKQKNLQNIKRKQKSRLANTKLLNKSKNLIANSKKKEQKNDGKK